LTCTNAQHLVGRNAKKLHVMKQILFLVVIALTLSLNSNGQDTTINYFKSITAAYNNSIIKARALQKSLSQLS